MLKAYCKAHTLFSSQWSALLCSLRRMSGKVQRDLSWLELHWAHIIARILGPIIKYAWLAFRTSHYTALNINIEEMLDHRSTNMKYLIIWGKQFGSTLLKRSVYVSIIEWESHNSNLIDMSNHWLQNNKVYMFILIF